MNILLLWTFISGIAYGANQPSPVKLRRCNRCNGDPCRCWKKGLKVQALYLEDGQYYDATIKEVYQNGSYLVKYDAGGEAELNEDQITGWPEPAGPEPMNLRTLLQTYPPRDQEYTINSYSSSSSQEPQAVAAATSAAAVTLPMNVPIPTGMPSSSALPVPTEMPSLSSSEDINLVREEANKWWRRFMNNNRGRHAHDGRVIGALTRYIEFIENDPIGEVETELAEAYCRRGDLYACKSTRPLDEQRMEMFRDMSEKDFEKAIELKPSRFEAHIQEELDLGSYPDGQQNLDIPGHIQRLEQRERRIKLNHGRRRDV